MTPTADLTFRPLLGDTRYTAELLGRPGVLRTGHFRLLSGLHTAHFLAFSRIAQDQTAVRSIARDLGAVAGVWAPSLVLAPSTAGVALGGDLADELDLPLYLAALDANGRAEGVLARPRLDGERVLLVNDVITTGDGLAAMRDVVVAAGGEAIGAACFASRSSVDTESRLGLPVIVTAQLDLDAFGVEDCPLCQTGDELEEALDIN